MTFTAIIPVRYGSTRLPGKALEDLHGKPMVCWVIQRCLASGAARVIAATDHDDIARASKESGAEVCMTSDQHRNGTERLAEAVNLLRIPDNDIVVNVQGDEPLIDPVLIRETAHYLASSSGDVATLAAQITSRDELMDRNVVKVVLDINNNALYFSRAPIPADDDEMNKRDKTVKPGMLKHVGVYAYRAAVLRKYTDWTECAIERHEKLEQLRLLWHGTKIAVHVTSATTGIGINTNDDLERARQLDKSVFERMTAV